MHQLAVYDLGSEGDGEPVLVERVELPAGATGWSPSADRCLEPGRHYAWSVRAVSDGISAEWSEIFTFRTPESALSVAQLDEVASRVREELEVVAVSSQAHGASPSRHLVQGTRSGDDAAPDLATVKATIRGTPSETTGEVAGVVGVSQSPDGAGLIAANTNPGAADLVLEGQSHGAEDTIVTESGIEVGGTSFSISGQPGLSVLIDGAEAVTSETISQHDTLGMLSCAENQVAQWDGSAWVCKTLMLGDIQIPIPDAPQHVRVVPNYLDPSTKRLAWSMADLTGVANFIVYQSPMPITESNKHLATRRVANDLWVPITVVPDTGLMHFRVEAVNIQGVAGELSREYRLNTTLRIQFEVEDGDGVETAYLATTTGALTPHQGGVWSPGGTRYAFQQADGTYVADEGGSAIKVSGVTDKLLLWSPDDYHLLLSNTDGSVLVDREGGFHRTVDGLAFWSPSGEAFAYTDDEVPSPLSVWRLDEAAPVVIDTDVRRPSWSWSPSGARLAYFKLKSSSRLDLWIADAQGLSRTNLSADLDGAFNLNWSPDGTRIAFGSFDDSTGTRNLQVTVIGSGDRVQVNPPSAGSGVWPYDFGSGTFPHPFPWSPEGNAIAYVSDHDSPGQNQVYVTPASAEQSVRVSEPLTHSEYVLPFWVAWSGSGAQLGIHVDPKWPDTWELFLWSRAEGTITRAHGQIPKKESIWASFGDSPAFSPDSQFIAYGHTNDLQSAPWNLYLVDASGSGRPMKLNPDGTFLKFARMAWVPQGWIRPWFGG